MTWLTGSAVAFLPASSSGFTLTFPSLTLHALTPASADTPAHIYCQIDESDGAAAGGAEDEEDSPMREARIYVAEDKGE